MWDTTIGAEELVHISSYQTSSAHMLEKLSNLAQSLLIGLLWACMVVGVKIRDSNFLFDKFIYYKFGQICTHICSPRIVFFVKVWQSLFFYFGTSTSTQDMIFSSQAPKSQETAILPTRPPTNKPKSLLASTRPPTNETILLHSAFVFAHSLCSFLLSCFVLLAHPPFALLLAYCLC